MNVDLASLPPPLVELLRGYATLTAFRYIKFPVDLSFGQVHSFLLDAILTNPYFTKYPPAQQYQQQFWKWAISNLDTISSPLETMLVITNTYFKDDEIDSRMYEHHVVLMSQSTVSQTMGSQPPVPSYFTYIWRSRECHKYESATLMESRTTIESGTTGLKTWRASLVLSQYLIFYPELVRHKRILELGSGVGLLGIITATLQMHEPQAHATIRLTDVNSDVLARCSANLNLECNKSASHPAVGTAALDWTDSLSETGIAVVHTLLQEIAPDIILGADVVYDPGIIPPLVETLRLALQNGDNVALIALTERNADTMTQFIQSASE
ncbi:hypothetical protein PHLGIDRAFT_63116 [Phlebiopsis gigantea 11061_1 CR5-6]|uniref:FAM86 N-terminal domain-containing protein n=1 Tax=Phlebiopsis gigantea (strain 11061_1 CR5-6) TaxID=745531 RepID=A0A0C3SFB2_PHLG1|nr:hypothetical protein PHLGIDRAFT_63116 [Phlebiopsis gigantea 11061_1 CR5-6]